jgi:hypothetical protein
VTPRYLSLSIPDSVTLHCITLTLLGSTIKLQEPSQETRNWGLPARNNPPLARNTQTSNTTNNNHYKTYTISLVITLIGDGSLHNVGMAPDVQALVLTHERIARWLCSAHDQQLCFLSLWSRGRQLRHRSTGAPMNPTLAARSANFTSFCCMRPSCAAISWCWRSTWPRTLQ